MNNTKLKIGDKVVVITGKDKGKQGEVMKIATVKDKKLEKVKIVVKGVNIVTKHIKASAQSPGQKIHPPFVGSFGIAIRAPSGSSSSDLNLFE